MNRNILVYGAGVLGSYLAHCLIQSGDRVTLLARGNRLRELKEHGLTIRHALQLKTTTDKVALIEELAPQDCYDVVFVVMQYTQMSEVLPVLAHNQSKLVVLIGNNGCPAAMRDDILRVDPDKTVLFGFLGVGGRREKGKVISIHGKPRLPIGSLSGEEYPQAKAMLEKLFEGSGIQAHFRNDMLSYLLSHVAYILPIAYACYATGGRLSRANKALLISVMDATAQGYDVLKAGGIPIAPAEDETYVREKRGAYYRLLWLLSKTFIGRLAVSDHAMSAVGEMTALSEAFDRLKTAAPEVQAPAWDTLRKHLPAMPFTETTRKD